MGKDFDQKPPLGLVPQRVHKRKRAIKILQAMHRYVVAYKPIPGDWLDELDEIAGVKFPNV